MANGVKIYGKNNWIIGVIWKELLVLYMSAVNKIPTAFLPLKNKEKKYMTHVFKESH